MGFPDYRQIPCSADTAAKVDGKDDKLNELQFMIHKNGGWHSWHSLSKAARLGNTLQFKDPALYTTCSAQRDAMLQEHRTAGSEFHSL